MAEQVELKDSNVAGIGSQEDKDARYDAAMTEREWKGAGTQEGIQIWRVENHKATATHGPRFGVKKWPKADYGTFYGGDSFIVLHTWKDAESDTLHYDIYYWLGLESSQDEIGVAAYKTVELDDLLGGKAHEHRVIQGAESKQFLQLFPKPIHILSGGVESGFNHVTPEKYNPRLLWVKGLKGNVRVLQVEAKACLMNHGDTFILDTGLELYQWMGRMSGPWEREKARELVHELKSARNGRPHLTVCDDDGKEDIKAFWDCVEGTPADVLEEGPPDTRCIPVNALCSVPRTRKLAKLLSAKLPRVR
jgi:gelsolin